LGHRAYRCGSASGVRDQGGTGLHPRSLRRN
jgi:hypothetical protein